MKVIVLLFAGVREAAGTGRIEIELAEGATVADAAAEVGRRLPAVAVRLKGCSMAVDLEVALPGQVLREGCEVAVLPAVSGG
jgi:MoaE-MoaD fusion protein